VAILCSEADMPLICTPRDSTYRSNEVWLKFHLQFDLCKLDKILYMYIYLGLVAICQRDKYFLFLTLFCAAKRNVLSICTTKDSAYHSCGVFIEIAPAV
jgi:hypothetical protein